MKIWDADVAGDVPGSEEAKPGTITSVSKQEFYSENRRRESHNP